MRFLLIILALVIVYLVLTKLFKKSPANKVSPPRAFESFAREFDGSPYSPEALREAYDDITSLTLHPIRRGDDLQKTLRLNPDDLDAVFERRYRRMGGEQTDVAIIVPIDTVEDYVRHLSKLSDGDLAMVRRAR